MEFRNFKLIKKLVTLPSLVVCWFLCKIRGLTHKGHFLLLEAEALSVELFSCFCIWLWNAVTFFKYLIVWNGQPEAQHLYKNLRFSFDGTIGTPSRLKSKSIYIWNFTKNMSNYHIDLNTTPGFYFSLPIFYLKLPHKKTIKIQI